MRICPQCGSAMTVDPRCEMPTEIAEPFHYAGTPIKVVLVRRPVALCNGCEYVEVISWNIERTRGAEPR